MGLVLNSFPELNRIGVRFFIIVTHPACAVGFYPYQSYTFLGLT